MHEFPVRAKEIDHKVSKPSAGLGRFVILREPKGLLFAAKQQVLRFAPDDKS